MLTENWMHFSKKKTKQNRKLMLWLIIFVKKINKRAKLYQMQVQNVTLRSTVLSGKHNLSFFFGGGGFFFFLLLSSLTWRQAACKVVLMLSNYSILANYTWLLVEGHFLFTLVSRSFFSLKKHLAWYIALSWGEERDSTLKARCRRETKNCLISVFFLQVCHWLSLLFGVAPSIFLKMKGKEGPTVFSTLKEMRF